MSQGEGQFLHLLLKCERAYSLLRSRPIPFLTSKKDIHGYKVPSKYTKNFLGVGSQKLNHVGESTISLASIHGEILGRSLAL
jgi:hypothetical protein